jgi:hypothetical protein
MTRATFPSEARISRRWTRPCGRPPGTVLANEIDALLSHILFYGLVHAVFILGRRFADRLRKKREIVIIIERHEDYAARPRGGHLRAVWRTLRITSESSCTL